MDDNTEEFEGNAAGKSSISADLIRGHINTIILRSLYDRDKYGYEIINEINEKSHGQYTLKQPTLYSALKRLENQGYIQAYWKQDEVSAGGRRKYFRLTDSGREITEHNQAEWEYSRTVIDNLISDRNFDFNQPAPTPVDFKILKQATSRVPVIHGEGEEGEEAAEDAENKQPAAGEPLIEARTYTVSEEAQTIYIDDPTKPAEKEEKTDGDGEKSDTVVYSAETEKPLSYSEQVFESGSTLSAEKSQAEGTADEAEKKQQPQPEESESIVTESVEQQSVAAEAASHQTTYTERTEESVQSAPAPQPSENTEVYEENTYSSQPQADAFAAERARYASQLSTSAEEEQRRQVHENYMKLIAGDDEKKPEREETAEPLIYNARPEQERDYKNLIDKLFDSALKNNEPEPVQQQAPRQAQATPQYVQQPAQAYQQPEEAEPASELHYGMYADAGRKAASDGLKINTSEDAFAAGAARQTTYDKGATLFKCSLIIGIIMLLEFTLTLLFRNELGVSIAYPIVILSLGLALVLVCGVLFGARWGNHMRKPTSLRYIITAGVITVILICIIIIFAAVIQTNWSSTAQVMANVVIPCIIALNIPIFTLSFYLFTK